MQTLGSRLSVTFLVLFILMCFSMTVFIFFEVYGYANSSTVPDPYVVFQFVSSMLISSVYAVMLLVMRSIAKDVARGRSPFTIVHAKQIKFMAWMFVVGFVLNIFISPDFVELMHVGELNLGVASDQLGRYPTLHLDAKSLIGAVVCFSLSSVWKYGALLQADSDDYL